MNKFKFDIQKNNLSWEKNFTKKCDSSSCKEKGEFRASKSRIRLNEYYFFCIDHICHLLKVEIVFCQGIQLLFRYN